MSNFRSPSGLLPDLYALTGLRMAKKIKDTVIKASIVNSIGAFMVQKGLHEGDFLFVIIFYLFRLYQILKTGSSR